MRAALIIEFASAEHARVYFQHLQRAGLIPADVGLCRADSRGFDYRPGVVPLIASADAPEWTVKPATGAPNGRGPQSPAAKPAVGPHPGTAPRPEPDAVPEPDRDAARAAEPDAAPGSDAAPPEEIAAPPASELDHAASAAAAPAGETVPGPQLAAA